MNQQLARVAPSPWTVLGWLVIAGIVVVAAFTYVGAPSNMATEFKIAGIIVAAWAILSLVAIQLYRRFGQPRVRS